MQLQTHLLIFLLAVLPAPATGEVQTVNSEQWTEFKHLSGASLKHPQDWTIQNNPDGVMLIPPDKGNNEVIVASGLPSNAAKPSSPEVSAYLDSLMNQMLPGLRRTGQPQSLAAADGEGALYSYEGQLPDGTPVVCGVYITIQNGFALSLSAIAPPAKLSTRAPVLRQIFASMTMSTAPTKADGNGDGNTTTSDDSRLIGMFTGESLAGGGGSGVYINTQLVYVLNADGTLYYGAQSHFDAATRDSNGNTKWSASGVTDGSVQSGRWRAQDGFLAITWDSGKQSYFAYGFEPDGSLIFRNPRTRKLINFYKRVQ